MTFGERLVYYRTKKNLTQKALAEILDITPTRLNYWEKDKREPDVEMIRRLSEALDVSANILIGYEEDVETKKAPASEEAEADKFSVEDMKFLLNVLGYGDKIDDLSEKDVLFLGGIFDLLDAWFN